MRTTEFLSGALYTRDATCPFEQDQESCSHLAGETGKNLTSYYEWAKSSVVVDTCPVLSQGRSIWPTGT